MAFIFIGKVFSKESAAFVHENIFFVEIRRPRLEFRPDSYRDLASNFPKEK